MFRVLIYFMILLCCECITAQHSSPCIKVNDVDSVEIRYAFTPYTTPEACVSREHFDSIFDAEIKAKQKNGYRNGFSRVILKEPYEYTLFIKIFNSLKPLPPKDVKVLPSEVKLIHHEKTKENMRYVPVNLCDLTSYRTNDPIRTNHKYIIYLRDGTVISCFASSSFVDYNNWRYSEAIHLDTLTIWYTTGGLIIMS